MAVVINEFEVVGADARRPEAAAPAETPRADASTRDPARAVEVLLRRNRGRTLRRMAC